MKRVKALEDQLKQYESTITKKEYHLQQLKRDYYRLEKNTLKYVLKIEELSHFCTGYTAALIQS